MSLSKRLHEAYMDGFDEWSIKEKQLAHKFTNYLINMNTPIYAENTGSNFEIAPAGSHVATCYGMIDLGTQKTTFNGETKNQRKVRLMFELSNELRTFEKDGESSEKPLIIFREFGLSMHENAALRKFLENWRGKSFSEDEAKKFDITKLLGKSCILTVQHTNDNGKTYANISGASPLMKGMSDPVRYNSITCLSFVDFDFDVYNSLSEKTKDKIALSPEYQTLQARLGMASNQTQQPQQPQQAEDDLPF